LRGEWQSGNEEVIHPLGESGLGAVSAYSLNLQGIQAGYGVFPVLWDISLGVEAGEIMGLLGSNGSGKTTLLNVIAGMIPVMSGSLYFLGEEISPLSTRKRVQFGITQIPEGRLLFAGLTVEQNLQMGAFIRKDKSSFGRELAEIYDLFPALGKRKNQLAGTLSGGEQQMCAIGRGLMARPRLLLIDELSLGLAPLIVDRIMDALKRVHRERKMTMLVVEQDVLVGLELANRACVLENGRIVKVGSSTDLANDPEIIRSYIRV
jgi:branched-chain amino acid transport system ATP-binding protein